MRRIPAVSCEPWKTVISFLQIILLAGVSIPPRAVAAPGTTTTPKTPETPRQAILPPAPPMRYFPGLEEPLVATGPVSESETKDLDLALKSFHDAAAAAAPGSDYDDYSGPLLAFTRAHPDSHWNAALYTNLGLGYYHAGYYSRTFAYLEKAWQLGRDATAPEAARLIDRAVGELAEMHARLGHAQELEALLSDIGHRPIGGPATELIEAAHEGLWSFHHTPEVSYLCGPFALRNMLIALKAPSDQVKIAEDARSGPRGFSLSQLAALADKTGAKYKLIYREPGQPIPVPSIVNLKLHHYAAITGRQGGLYRVQDPTFGGAGGAVLSSRAIEAEASGYFLVPSSVLSAHANTNWRLLPAHSAEALSVYGMGFTTWYDIGATMCQDPNKSDPNNSIPTITSHKSSCAPQACGCGGQPMAAANAHLMTANLHLSDTPVGYSPQVGPPSLTTAAYNAREAILPANLSFSNLGPKWTHSWQGYIQDDPPNPGNNVIRAATGGGGYIYTNNGTYNDNQAYNIATGAFYPEPYDNSVLHRVPAAGPATSYIRYLPDGSQEIYALSNGAASSPRLMFLSQVKDRQGNATTLNYDSQFRLTSIVDAVGRATTFSYALVGHPLLITKVTDPFGRFARFTYDTSARLESISDPIGITSSFTYGSASEPNFITKLTTPYGSSNFSDGIPTKDGGSGGNVRAVLLTDPMGYRDFIYTYPNPPPLVAQDPANTWPVGMDTGGYGYVNYRNTFYFGRHAFAFPGAIMLNSNGSIETEDVTKSRIIHWAHEAIDINNVNNISPVQESVKLPLENRVWLNYPNQARPTFTGTLYHPTFTGRVLDDGTTQLLQASYTAQTGLPLSITDPVGRSTTFAYAANNIDLLTVQQLTTAPSTYTTVATFGNYNTQHEPQTYAGPDGKTWSYSYNAAGQVATMTDPNGSVTTYNYDGKGRLTKVINANNATALTLTYDSADRVRTRTDSEGYTLSYEYDNIDRVTAITYPDGTTDLYDYTFQSGPSAGMPSLDMRKHTDRLGHSITYGYDADRRVTSVTEPLTSSASRTTRYDYYEDGTLKDITDPNGNVTHWQVDLESRPVSKTYGYGTANAETETYAYESTTSRLHSVTDAMGQVKTFTYAQDDSLTGITYTNTVNPTPNVTFSYDPKFLRVSAMTDGTGTTAYSYYPIGGLGALRLQQEATPFTNGTITYAYDPLGRLASRAVDNSTETFAYDKLSRLVTHGTALGTFNLGYLGQTSQMTSQLIATGTVGTTWQYDTNTNDRRLKAINNSGATRSFAFTTTPENLITQIQDTAPRGSAWAPKTWNYTYDDAYRLTDAASSAETYAYGLDPTDNITSFKSPGATTSASYNALNQIVKFGSEPNIYDKNGNVLDDGLHTYTWDAENRLLSVTSKSNAAQKTTFLYDGMGRRTAIDTMNGMTSEARYLWCGEQLCQARTSSDVVERRYYSEGEYLPLGGTSLYYSQDQLGSVREVLATQNGSQVATFDYDPYGNPIQSNGRVSTDFRFAGLFYDQQDGLYLTHHRPYDPAVGRWLNRDPSGESGGVNLYAYVRANPTIGVDPTGLDIRLYSTEGGLHGAIAIDTGTDCDPQVVTFGFGPRFVWTIPVPPFYSLGEIDEGNGGQGYGRIAGGSLVETKTLSTSEGNILVAQLRQLAMNPPLYNLVTFNCWIFASFVFYYPH